MERIKKLSFITEVAIGILVGFYVMYALLNQGETFQGSNLGVFLTFLFALFALICLRIYFYLLIRK